MDVENVLAQLREELARLEAAILKLKGPSSPAQEKRWRVFYGRKAKPVRGAEQGDAAITRDAPKSTKADDHRR